MLESEIKKKNFYRIRSSMSTELHPPPEIAAAVPQENPFASWFGTILRSIAIYWVVSSLTRSFSSPSTGTSTPTVGASLSQSVWDSKGTVFDLDVYLSEQAQYNPSRDLKGPLFHFGELSMSDWDSKLESSGHVDAPIVSHRSFVDYFMKWFC